MCDVLISSIRGRTWREESENVRENASQLDK